MKRRRPSRPGGRNFSDPRYAAWRKAVRVRDGGKCRRCRGGGRLNVHHIRPWAAFPGLRFAVSNGICLCQTCHKLMTGREEMFAGLCFVLLRRPA